MKMISFLIFFYYFCLRKIKEMERLIFLLAKSIRASLIMGCMIFLTDLNAQQNIGYKYLVQVLIDGSVQNQ